MWSFRLFLGDDVDEECLPGCCQKCSNKIFAKFHFSSSPVTCNLQPRQKLKGCQYRVKTETEAETELIHNNVLSSGMFLHTVAHCDMPDEFVRTCVQLQLQLQLFRLHSPYPAAPALGGGTDTDKFNFVRSVCRSEDTGRADAVELACHHEF